MDITGLFSDKGVARDRNSGMAFAQEKACWNARRSLRTRLYILVLGAILMAQTWTVAAQSKEGGQPQKKKIQVILVDKKERDKPGSSGRSEKPRPEPRNRQ